MAAADGYRMQMKKKKPMQRGMRRPMRPNPIAQKPHKEPDEDDYSQSGRQPMKGPSEDQYC